MAFKQSVNLNPYISSKMDVAFTKGYYAWVSLLKIVAPLRIKAFFSSVKILPEYCCRTYKAHWHDAGRLIRTVRKIFFVTALVTHHLLLKLGHFWLIKRHIAFSNIVAFQITQWNICSIHCSVKSKIYF